jgi:hypothetical protein
MDGQEVGKPQEKKIEAFLRKTDENQFAISDSI